MSSSRRPASGSDGVLTVQGGRRGQEHGFSEPAHSSWFLDTFGRNPYPFMERLAPHRIVLAEQLRDMLAPAVLGDIRNAVSDWEGIKVLCLDISARAPRHRRLREAIERMKADLPQLEEQLRANPPSAAGIRHPPLLLPAAVFPEPLVCEGRDDLLVEIVDNLTGQGYAFRSAILHGVGGIGKSTVALEVLHRLEVVAHFRDRRFFVGCENLSTLDDLVGRLTTQLAIDTSKRDPKTAICEFGGSSPALLVLDNFEDLWNADGPTTEPFLSSVAKTDGFNLIITKRGSSDVRLPRTQSFPIDTLGHEAALSAFTRHANRTAFDARPDPDLPQLLHQLDGYPLALMLLAHRYDASSGVTAKQLAILYKRQRSDCLRRGETDSRQTSLRASVELSLASKAMSAIGAKELCFLLSLLPDGAEDELVDMFLDRTAHRFSSGPLDLIVTKQAVIGAGLASRSAQGLLRMLAPLRELFASLHGAAEAYARADSRSSIHAHTGILAGISQGIFRQSSAEESVALRRRVSIQLGNLSEDVKFHLTPEEPSEIGDAVSNACDLAWFISHTVPFVPGFLCMAIEGARSYGLVQGEADCERVLGQILIRIDQLGAARSSLRRALALSKAINDRWREAHALYMLGFLAWLEDDHWAARPHLESARVIFEGIGDQDWKAYTLKALGDVAWWVGDLRLAEAHLQSARAIFNNIANRVGEAEALESLGDLAIRRDDLPLARTYLVEALGIFKEIGDRSGEARTLRSHGELALRQDDITLAQVHLGEALEVAREIADRVGEADALERLGRLALRQNDFTLAQARLDEALGIFKEVAGRAGEAQTLNSLGDLALQQDDLPLAQMHLDNALAVFTAIGSRGGESDALRGLGDLALRRGNLFTAQMCLCSALTISEEIDLPLRQRLSTRLLDGVDYQLDANSTTASLQLLPLGRPPAPFSARRRLRSTRPVR